MQNSIKNVTFLSIYFFIVLFVYTAVSKLIDFENFQVQIAQSPLLSAFATTIAYGVVIGELIIALLLCFRETQKLGLYLFLGFMVAFSVYIYLILNFSPFVPCSCGGVLEKMGWTAHLWFNSIICILAIWILLYRYEIKRTGLLVIVTLFISCLVVISLFFTSEHLMKKENPFVRRFIPHHIDKAEYLDLGVNSYYIAGLTQDTIYLGNYTAPLLITAISRDLKTKVEHQIKLDETERSFRSLLVRIQNDTFFVSDGSIPIIYRGDTSNWYAHKFMTETIYFSLLQPLTENTFLFRSQRASNGEHVLGKLLVTDTVSFELYEDALQKQIDGVFDTDGQLVTDQKTQQGIYTYTYRNQYLVYHSQSNTFTQGKTIDTTTLAKIKVSQLADGTKKMGAPPQKVNAKTYAYKGKLYIKSELLGKNEPKSMWNQASIIDVYDYNKNEYLYSFYAYDHQKDKIKEFALNDLYFFGLVGNELVKYELGMGKWGNGERGKWGNGNERINLK
ncbi:MauE/DoxX family redox-associated membrane protein [Flavobacterium sp. I3-2]|uniref:MauE/DoxX family redox-associated membrane protein n=1 Tax=Flavobacterium sp. I3-2 TaxID=2748319 RepID=UPI0015A7848F|nr:MauE/DoxX family redox-associated membrane protein [Flavobacterium sp. I3-2]